MNQFMSQQKKVPQVHELWKDELNKYRLWIILFFVGTGIIIVLSLVAVILNGIGINNGYIDILQKALNGQSPKAAANVTYHEAKLTYISSLLLIPSLMILLLIISIYLSINTIIKSYKNHNFAKISGAGIFIIQLSAFLALINIVQFIIHGWGTVSAFPGTIYSTIVMFLYIPLWYFAIKVSRIRKLFIYSQRVNDPEFQKNMEQMRQQFMNATGQNFGNNNPFGFKSNSQSTPSNNSTTTTNNTNSENANKNVEIQKPKVSETDIELSKLTIPQLRSIAKKLYISGYETMLRDELINNIKRTTNE